MRPGLVMCSAVRFREALFPPPFTDTLFVRTAMLVIFFSAWCAVAAAGGVTAGAAAGAAVSALAQGGAIAAARPLRAGDQISGRVFENDRIEWKLPAKRLERFRKAGVIITEEHRITSVVLASVVSASAAGSVVRLTVHTTSYDVPRATTTVADQTSCARLMPDNEPGAHGDLDVAGAALVGLPISFGEPGRIGRRWRTRVAVTTELGTGVVTFYHSLIELGDGRVEIGVTGTGTITGAQYHLPKLLPGSIQMHGTAWYDVRTGIVTQESYYIHNRLLKPAEGEQIGFDQRLTVDATSRLRRAAPSGAGEE